MKKCKFCNINVETEKNFCPICYNKFDIDDGNATEIFYPLRKHNDYIDKRNSIVLKLFIFLSICLITFSITLNLMLDNSVHWFWVVILSDIYLWVLIAHTIMSKRTIFKKIFLQLLSLIILLFAVQRLSNFAWLFTYVFPLMSITCVFVLCMLLFTMKNRSELVIGFLFIFLVLIIISSICLISKIDTLRIINIISLITSSLAFIGTIIFGYEALKTELSKKWHL